MIKIQFTEHQKDIIFKLEIETDVWQLHSVAGLLSWFWGKPLRIFMSQRSAIHDRVSLCLKNYWHVLLPFVLVFWYLVWVMCNLQHFEVCYFSLKYAVSQQLSLYFFPGIILLKDSTGFSLSIEQRTFLLSAPPTTCIYQHACFQWKEYISSWMEVLFGFLNCYFLTMIFDWL